MDWHFVEEFRGCFAASFVGVSGNLDRLPLLPPQSHKRSSPLECQ